MSDLWEHENFVMGYPDLSVPLFPRLDFGTAIAYTDEVKRSPLCAIFEDAGEILPGTIEDTGEPLYVLNILTMYDCIDEKRSVFKTYDGITDKTSWRLLTPVFHQEKIGTSSLFKVPIWSSTIYTVTDRPDMPVDFYSVCEKNGWLDCFEFKECSFS